MYKITEIHSRDFSKMTKKDLIDIISHEILRDHMMSVRFFHFDIPDKIIKAIMEYFSGKGFVVVDRFNHLVIVKSN